MASAVAEWYRGRDVLVTGGSGLMGKVLVEKLLYSARGVGNIYLLLRPKRGQAAPQRLDHIWTLPLFQRLRHEFPEARSKLVALHGDVTLPGLGLSPEDRRTVREHVSVVFHFAATLRLEAPLKDCLDMNTAGTLRVLEVARGISRLELVVHLSTAFCYPDYEVLDEVVHPAPHDPRELVHALEWLDGAQLELLRPSLLGPHPNGYTYSKRLAEQLVSDAYSDLPVVIVRPSIVTPAIKEPLPGWVDNLNGPIGLMVGAGKGVIRTMLCDGDLTAQVIPVDIAINAIITITQQEATRKERAENIPVYNVSAGDVQPTTWGAVLELGKAYSRRRPFEWPLWYPNGGITTNLLVHYVKVALFHWIPAYFIDFLLLIFRQKRFMLRVQEKVSQGLELLQYFTTREWVFETSNFKKVYEKVSEKDKVIFPQDLTVATPEDYISTCIEGGRLYCLKESPARIPYSRQYHNLLFVLDIIAKSLFFVLCGWLLMRCFS